MRRIFVLLSLLFAAALANASTVTVVTTNFNSYGKGAVCVVSGAANGAFELLFHADDFSTDRTSRASAAKLIGFFEESEHGDCYIMPLSGVGRVPVPDRDNVYVVTVVMEPSGSRAYWNITNIEGEFDQVITVEAQ